MYRLEPVHHAVKHQEEIPPGDELLAPLEAHARFIASTNEEFVNVHLFGNFFKRLFCVNNRERNQNGARPRRNLVDVEPEPVGKQDNLRRNRRDGIVVVLAKKAEINFSERVDLGYTTEIENLFPSAHERGVVRLIAGKFEAEIRLHRGTDIRRPTVINGPTAVFILEAKNLIRAFLKSLLIARAEEHVHQDVVRL